MLTTCYVCYNFLFSHKLTRTRGTNFSLQVLIFICNHNLGYSALILKVQLNSQIFRMWFKAYWTEFILPGTALVRSSVEEIFLFRIGLLATTVNSLGNCLFLATILVKITTEESFCAEKMLVL